MGIVGIFNFVFTILVIRILTKWRRQKIIQQLTRIELDDSGIEPVAHDHGAEK